MFKFFWRRSASRRFDEASYVQDPLSHPALAAMSERQLADLPFDPYAFGNAGSVSGVPAIEVLDDSDALRGLSLRNGPRPFRNS